METRPSFYCVISPFFLGIAKQSVRYGVRNFECAPHVPGSARAMEAAYGAG